MIQEASSEARKSTARVTSAGSPIRPSGYHCETRSKICGSTATRSSQIGVRIEPGAIAFARIPYRPYATAVLCVRLIRPAFAAL